MTANNPSFASFNSSRASKNRTFTLIDPTDDSIFTAGLDDVSSMNKILHELHHSDEYSVLVINEEGLRLITAGEKAFQVSAFFSAASFQRFEFDKNLYNQITLKFTLRDFIESLNLLRDDPLTEGDKLQLDDDLQSEPMKTSLYIQYRKKGEPLKLKLENKSNYVINCDLKGFNLTPDTVFRPLGFLDSEETAIIVFNSKRLYDFVSGLDLVSSDFVHLVMGRGEVPIKLSTKSTLLGEVELEITENETEIIKREMIVSDNCLFSFSYRTQFIKPALEALRTSKFSQMKCGSSGLLCIEHIHPNNETRSSARDGAFMRPDNVYLSQNSMDFVTDYNQPQNKRSSVEYFILSEAKPIDACPD